jgi:hypothetical protein
MYFKVKRLLAVGLRQRSFYNKYAKRHFLCGKKLPLGLADLAKFLR